MWQRCFVAAAGLTCAALIGPAYAQRAAENAVNSAEDAFGVSLGNENVGLYNSNSARGFNPLQAGNLRVDGLYWDQQGQAPGRTYASTTMRVGLSAQSYPFPAPTGIVDTRLSRPADHFSGSVALGFGPYESLLIDTEVSGPLVADKLGVYATLKWERPQLDQRGKYINYASGAVLRWTPSDTVDVVAFHQRYDANKAKVAPTFSLFSAGGAIPTEYDRSIYFTQPWAARTRHVNHTGTIISATVFDDWLWRTGIFRSHQTLDHDFFIFYRNVGPDGVGTLDVLKTAPLRDVSYSGETRQDRRRGYKARTHLHSQRVGPRQCHAGDARRFLRRAVARPW